METNPIRVCELLVGLPDVNVLGVDDDDGPLRVHVNARLGRPSCPGCGGVVWRKDRNPVVLVDLLAFGCPVRLVWHKQRWECPDDNCPTGSFTAQAPRIAPPRAAMTDGLPAGVVILQFAMPPAVFTALIALEHDLVPDLVTTTVLAGTVASVLTLPVVIALL